MAIEKTTARRGRIIGDYTVECFDKIEIKDNNVIISTNLTDKKKYYPDSDWSSENDHAKKLCNTHLTAAVKSAWKKLSDDEKTAIKGS